MASRRQPGIDLHERLLDLVGRHAERSPSARDRPPVSSPPRAPCARCRNRRAALSPEQVPCLSHWWKIRRGAGIRSSMEETILRSSRGAGTWQNSGKALLVLRPQPVHDEGIGPRRALLLRRRPALARRLAKRRRPGQREHVEIELAGLVLAPVLRRGAAKGERQRDGDTRDANDTSNADRTKPTIGTPITQCGAHRGTVSMARGTFQEQKGNKGS